MKKQTNTGWGDVAEWYDKHLSSDDTFHAQVITPNLLRIVAPRGKNVLEIGCGEGYFSRLLAAGGAEVVASDISEELISIAEKKGGNVQYHVAPADVQPFVDTGTADIVLAVLTLQNMERIDSVMMEAARALSPTGSFICVLNHPAFRIPKSTHWEFDGKTGTQYRRVDAYLSAQKIPMEMRPGAKATGKQGSTTYSFHRSLQDFTKAFANAGFAITRLEEWVSHKQSQKGPRAKSEDTARREFPLFMCIECKKV
jgi:ubiquinone/menaquinone biosynthesis C-methylase UbiE